ncbi:MAG: HAD family hydrolase [Bacteroidaceae bacterium]|nr:HAD family hydrolase [Bacteroidaceae bacterium]
MSSIKGIIFDYGGTIDTNGIHWGEFIWEQYKKAGIDITRDTYREAYVHGERFLAKNPVIEQTDTFHRLLRKKIAIHFDYLRDIFPEKNFKKEVAETIADGCYNKVKETLESTCGIIEKLSYRYPLVLVTNFYGNMPVVLEEFNLSGFFNEIVESSVVGIRKPDPALFALGVESMGIEAQDVVVIGDSYRKDIYPSSTLGCKTVWLKNICWEEEPIVQGHEATSVIPTLEMLPDIIEQI